MRVSIAQDAMEGRGTIRSLVERFYGPDGPLAEAGWEIRDQQVTISLDMADALDGAAEDGAGSWVLHEAPTGTGKGLAYLVPGLLAALRAHAEWREEDEGKREKTPPKFVVSTANIALQEQLIRKDIPAIADMLGVDIRAFLLKSRQNYVCRKRVLEAGQEDPGLLAEPDFQRVLDWTRDPGCTGDRESMPWDPGKLWPRVSSTSDDCLGRGCRHYARSADVPWCYWRAAIQGWERAHVVVANHHFLAVYQGINSIALAVDEVHELENSLRSVVTCRLTRGAARAAASRYEKALHEDDGAALIERPVGRIMDAVQRMYERANGRSRWPSPVAITADALNREGGGLSEGCGGIKRAADRVATAAREVGAYMTDSGRLAPPRATGDQEQAERAARLCALHAALINLYERATAAATGLPFDEWPGEDWAIYVDSYGRRDDPRFAVYMSPADVSWAATALRARYPVAALTSATVPEEQSFRLTMGLVEDGSDLSPLDVFKRLPSPYDLETQGALVVPRGPSPKDATWRAWAAERVVDAVLAAEGRTLVLASSIAQMRRYGEALREATRYPVQVQGEAGRGTLRAWFHDNTEGVLVATRSFFQGLDVQGEACSCVVIDRVPFTRPDDLVEAAIQNLLVRRNGGGSGYMLRSIPQASMTLAQGAGRLIRSKSDRGAVVVLDSRLLNAGEGWQALRRALPAFPLTYAVEDVRRVLCGDELEGRPQAVQARRISRGARF